MFVEMTFVPQTYTRYMYKVQICTRRRREKCLTSSVTYIFWYNIETRTTRCVLLMPAGPGPDADGWFDVAAAAQCYFLVQTEIQLNF